MTKNQQINQALELLLRQGRVRVDISGRYVLVEEQPKTDFTIN